MDCHAFELVFAVPVQHEEATCSFESDSLLLLNVIPIDCEVCSTLFEKDQLILVNPLPIAPLEADQTFECDSLILEVRIFCEAHVSEMTIETDALTLEDRILIHCSEADQTYEQDQLTLEVRCIIASEELTYHEEVDALWVRKAAPALDHPETTVEHCSLSIIKLHRIEALEINQTFEEQYQKVHDRLIVQEYVIENTLIETYFISKEDLDDLLEIESLMNERRTGITVKRDLTNISQNLSKINLNGKPGMTRILHR